MKTIFTFTVMLGVCVWVPGCSPLEQREWGEAFPRLSSTTQMVEEAQQRLDPLAQQGEAVADVVRDAAAGAQAIGIPGAGLVAVVASVVGTLLGAYNERRRGTIPLREAVEQIVQSVETAFPERSDAQKAALAAVQDRATRRVVSGIKGE